MRYSLYENTPGFQKPDEWGVFVNMILLFIEEQGKFISPGGHMVGMAEQLNKYNPKPRQNGVIVVVDEDESIVVAIPESHPFYNTRLLHEIQDECGKGFKPVDLASEVINTIIKS